jgi:hypothetical protein
MKTLFPALLAGAVLSISIPAAAQPPSTDVRWTCGGIGSDERQMLEDLRRDAKLEMLFVTAKRGGYVAGARVSVHRGDTTVASFEADGPICLVDLPAGTYRIEARIGEANATSVVTISPKGGTSRAVFRFPDEKSDPIEASEEEKRQARER